MNKSRQIQITVFFLLFLFLGSTIGLTNRIGNSEITQRKQFLPTILNGMFHLNNTYATSMDYYPGELLVKFKDPSDIHVTEKNRMISTGIASLDVLLANNNVQSIRPVFENAKSASLSAWYLIQFENNVDIRTLLTAIKRDPHVITAELNKACTIFSVKETSTKRSQTMSDIIPNDPLFDKQWGLMKIDAPSAWTIEKGNQNITIAIVDTGVDYTHPDLSANIWTNTYGDHGYDYVNNDNDPMDDNGHGTICAGIAAAVTNNSLGVAGVCWNCKIMAVKALNAAGEGYDSWLAPAIVYATDNGADVISMSWGSGYTFDLVKDAIDYAYNHHIVLVAAAGNSHMALKAFPADLENVIAVAASNQSDGKAWFSSYGEWVTVAAPGVSIYSTKLGGDYTHDDGTSMSCPFVAGVAALILSQHPQCPCPPQMVRSILTYTTDPTQGPDYIGTGRVNASRAVQWEPYAAILDPIYHWENAKGSVDIPGAAWAENIRYFTLEYGTGSHPSSWSLLENSTTSSSGELYSLDTNLIAEGLYTIRLTLVTSMHSYSTETPLYVNNKADGEYTADLYVSDCYNSSTPGWRTTRFTSIQAAINQSKRGDTIFVYDGIYPEDVCIRAPLRNIKLIGQHKEWSIIDGSVLLNRTSKVTVAGLTIRGVSNYFIMLTPTEYSLRIYRSPSCICSDNIFQFPGVTGPIVIVDQWSHRSVVERNIVQWRMIPAQIYSGAISVTLNTNVNISSNIVTDPLVPYDIFQTLSTIIYNNSIGNNDVYIPLSLYSCVNALIMKNTVPLIYLTGSVYRSTIVGNELSRGIGILVGDDFNRIYYNNIGSCIDSGNINFYDKPKGLFHGTGNYWGDYNGTDANGDGIGDTPYLVKGSICRDRFPFMKPIDLKNLTGVGDIFKGYLDSPFFLLPSRIHSFDILLKTL
jgi:thermitase